MTYTTKIIRTFDHCAVIEAAPSRRGVLPGRYTVEQVGPDWINGVAAGQVSSDQQERARSARSTHHRIQRSDAMNNQRRKQLAGLAARSTEIEGRMSALLSDIESLKGDLEAAQ